MAEDVQGFFRMLATSPKTVSLAAGIACAAPYVLREQIDFPAPYLGLFTVASVFFLMLYLVLTLIAGVGFLAGVRQSRRRLTDLFASFTFEELDTIAAFVVQKQHSLYIPGDAPLVRRLLIYDVVTTLHTQADLQRFELADWARALVERRPSLLKGADGTVVARMSKENVDRLASGAYDRY